MIGPWIFASLASDWCGWSPSKWRFPMIGNGVGPGDWVPSSLWIDGKWGFGVRRVIEMMSLSSGEFMEMTHGEIENFDADNSIISLSSGEFIEMTHSNSGYIGVRVSALYTFRGCLIAQQTTDSDSDHGLGPESTERSTGNARFVEQMWQRATNVHTAPCARFAPFRGLSQDECDTDDGEFISTFFTVVQSLLADGVAPPPVVRIPLASQNSSPLKHRISKNAPEYPPSAVQVFHVYVEIHP
ncbi:hypothetical protein LXL04_024291 [Taraxacum kok-saghyz]